MRTKEEIMDMVMQIDNGIDAVKGKDDIQYLEDVKAALQCVLKKISSGQEVSKIEEEMRYVIYHSSTDDLGKDEIKTLTDFMNKEFEGYFKSTGTLGLDTTACNVSDAGDWILERTTTKQFLTDYLMLETAGLFYRGEPVR